jgi:hypothetical protein
MNEVTAESAENAAVNDLANPRRTALDVSKTGRLEYGSDDQLQRAALKNKKFGGVSFICRNTYPFDLCG